MQTYIIKPSSEGPVGVSCGDPVPYICVGENGENLLLIHPRRRIVIPSFKITSTVIGLEGPDYFQAAARILAEDSLEPLQQRVEAMGEEAARHLGEDASLVIWYASLPTVSTPDGWKTGVVDFHVGLAWVESTNLDIEGEFLVREGVWVPQAPSVEEIEPPIFNSHVGRKSARSWAGQISSRLADACLG